MTRAGYKAALVISLALSLFLAGSGGEIVPSARTGWTLGTWSPSRTSTGTRVTRL